jgi:ADP-ribose pyrophosphatase YjhB (NUDIX family)
MQPGYGVRDPGLERVLARAEPAGSKKTVWGKGTLPLRVTAFLGSANLPSDLVTSVRCFVQVRNQIVVCQTPSGSWHPWPGGRQEPRESFAETAYREVHEETGWQIDPETTQMIGWLHLEHLKAPPRGHPFPHPDFLQVVLMASSTFRDGGEHGDWTDTEGYELCSRLVSIDEARVLTAKADMPVLPFLDVVEKTLAMRR